MPPAVGAILVAATQAVLTYVGASVLVSALVTLAVTVAVSALAKKPKNANRLNQGLELRMKVDPAWTRQVGTGRFATGGSCTWAYTRTDKPKKPNRYLYRVITLSDHPCQGLVSVKEGKSTLTFSGDITTGWRACDQHRNKDGQACMWARLYLGSMTPTADATLVSESGGIWTSAHKGVGACYVILKMDYDPDAFPQGEPELFFILDGARCYDDRADSTKPGGSGPQRINDYSTYVYTRNAGVITAQLLRGFKINGKLIVGVQAEERDLDSAMLMSCFNTCDQDVSLAAGGTEKRYRAGMLINANEPVSEQLVDLQAAMDGKIFDRGGAITLLPGAIRTPVLALTDTDIVWTAEKSWQPKATLQQLVNHITGNFVDEGSDFQEKAFPVLASSQWELDDGGERFSEFYSFRAINSWAQVQRVTKRIFSCTRFQATVAFVGGPWLIELEQGDWFTLTSARWNFTNKYFEAMEVNILKDGSIAIIARETSPTIDGWVPATDEKPRTDTTWNPPVYALPVPGISVTPYSLIDPSGVQQFGGTVNLTDDPADIGAFVKEVYVEIAPTAALSQNAAKGSFTIAQRKLDITGLSPATSYSVRASTTDGLRWSAWSSWVAFTTDGAEDIVAAPTFTLIDFNANTSHTSNVITKVGGTTGLYDASTYSAEAWNGVFLSFKMKGSGGRVLAGFASNPASSTDYTIMEYCIYVAADSTMYIHEKGVNKGTVAGTATDNTVYGLYYDNLYAYYYVDGNLVRKVEAPAGLILHFMTSIANIGGWCEIIAFSPSGIAAPPSKTLSVNVDRNSVTYDSGGGLNPASQTTTLVSQLFNSTADVVWTIERKDGVLLDANSYLSGVTAFNNLLWQSESFNSSPWTLQTNTTVTANVDRSPAGDLTADRVTDNDAAATGYVYQNLTVTNTGAYNCSVFVKKTVGATVFPTMQLQFNNGGTQIVFLIDINTNTGAYSTARASAPSNVWVEDFGDWWRVTVIAANNGTGNNRLQILLCPAATSPFGTASAAITGSAVFWGAMATNLFAAQTWPYIRTQGAARYGVLGSSVTMDATAFTTARGGTQGVTVRATVCDKQFLQDSASIVAVYNGSNGSPGTPAVNASLSRAAATVWAYANGSVIDWSPAAGQVKVTNGSTDVTATATYSATPSAGVTGSVNSSGAYSITNMTGNTGQLTITVTYASQVFTLIFNVTKAIVGYEVVSSLPVSNLFEGRVVFLTTDDKLYRYNGTAWTTSVPTSDLTGQVVSTQISDSAITTPKLAAGAVTTNELGAGVVTAAKVAASNLITLSAQINDGIITNAKIGNLEVDSAKIANLTVGTGKITNGAISNQVTYYNNADIALPASTSVEIATLNITTTGQPVFIVATFTTRNNSGADYALSIYIQRDGVTVRSNWGTYVADGVVRFWSLSLTDTGASAAAHTYRILVNYGSAVVNGIAANRSLYVLELMK